MARSFTLLQLRTRLRQLCDIETSRFFSDTELNAIISAAYAKLFAELVKHNLGYADETTVQWNTDGVLQTKALAADFFALSRVEFQYSSQYWYPLDEVDVRELPNVQATISSPAYWYRLVGPNLLLYPLPPVGTYRYVYIAAPADLTSDVQTIDGVLGWEDGVLFDAAIRVALKEEKDTSGYRAERDAIWERIQGEAQLRNMHVHNRIVRRPPWRRRPSDYDSDGYRRFDPSDWPPWRS